MIREGKTGVEEVEQMLAKFHSGEIEFLKTGIDWLDDSLLGGISPSTIIGIAALSGHGKTYLLQQIESNIKEKYDDVVFVNCVWELTEFKLLTRELAKETNRSVRQVYSEKPTPELQARYDEILSKFKKPNCYVQPEPVDADTFFEDIKSIIKKHPNDKIIVSIDNLENVLLSQSKSQKMSMDLVLQRVNILAKLHKFISFVILNQLNNDFEDNMSNPANMFPTAKSVYGTRQLEKISDVLIIKVLPYRLGISKYGVFSKKRYKYIPDEYKYNMNSVAKTTNFLSDGMAYFHVVKARGLEEEFDAKNLYVEKIFDVPEDKEEEKITEFDY